MNRYTTKEEIAAIIAVLRRHFSNIEDQTTKISCELMLSNLEGLIDNLTETHVIQLERLPSLSEAFETTVKAMEELN